MSAHGPTYSSAASWQLPATRERLPPISIQRVAPNKFHPEWQRRPCNGGLLSAAYCSLAGVMSRAEPRIDRSIHFQARRCAARKALNFCASIQYSPQALGDTNRRRLFCRVRIRRCATENSLQAISILFDRFSKAASFKMTPACCRQAFLAIVSRAVI